MVMFAAWALFAWGALAAGYGAYALSAASASHSAYHAAQAGAALLIATVSVSAGVLVLLVDRLGRVQQLPEPPAEEGDGTEGGEGVGETQGN